MTSLSRPFHFKLKEAKATHSGLLPLVLLRVSVSESPILFLVDSGSNVNLLSSKVVDPSVALKKTCMRVSTLSGKTVPLVGSAAMRVQHRKKTVGLAKFLVTRAQMNGFHGILGSAFFRDNNAVIDYAIRQLRLGKHRIPFVSMRSSNPLEG